MNEPQVEFVLNGDYRVNGTACSGGQVARCVDGQVEWCGQRYGELLFEPVDGGSILHAALQRFDAMLQSEGLSWHDFSREDARRLSALALQQEAGVYRNLLLYKSARDEGRLGRYAKRLLRTVDTLQYQIRNCTLSCRVRDRQ